MKIKPIKRPKNFSIIDNKKTEKQFTIYQKNILYIYKQYK